MSSVSLVTGCCAPVHEIGGSRRGILLKEKAMATSSITSQACITSGRVMGTRTWERGRDWDPGEVQVVGECQGRMWR
jgi:hypothetical protein